MGGSLETKMPLEGLSMKELKGGNKTRIKKGGSVLADMSVPAGLLFLNQFFKRRKATNKVKGSKKRKATRKATRKTTRKARRGKK
tara:strand:- start:69 stop:323 length:255 start_codon:yes stop_codon:yes gene_type:complete